MTIMKMSVCTTTNKPSSFSVRDILDLPEVKSPCSVITNQPVSTGSLPGVPTSIDGLPDCPLPYGTSPVNYSGIFPDHFPRYLPNTTEDITAYSTSGK